MVRRQQDGRPGVVDVPDLVPQELAQFDVDPRSRLVEDHDRWAVHQRFRHHQAAAHAARQRARVDVGLVGQPHHLQQRLGLTPAWRDPVEAGLQLQCLPGREERIEDELLRHDADGEPRLSPGRVEVVSVDFNLAAALHDQPGQDIDQRRLAGTVRTQQPEDRSPRDLQADAPERPHGRLTGLRAVHFLEAANADSRRRRAGHGIRTGFV